MMPGEVGYEAHGRGVVERIFITGHHNNKAPFMEQHLRGAASIERCEILC
jgi:hypothetical protein